MKGRYLLLIVLALTCAIVFNPTYSYYVADKHVTLSANGSSITCDAEIVEVPSSEKSIYGYSEFKVIVKNYDTNGIETNEDFDYTLTIENDNSSSGLFGYENDNFSSSLVINGSMNNLSAYDDNYIIQVKSSTGAAENVDYKVSLSCVQSN